jgi:hypothetical protein
LTGSLTFTDGGTSNEEFQARILVSTAKKSSDDTSRRVAMTRKRNAEYGEWRSSGDRRPYGFELDGITFRPEEIAVQRDVANRILAGESLRAIAQDLRDRGVPTVTGAAWSAKTLKDIMIRPRTAGLMVYQGKETSTKAPWEPILSEDVWNAVKEKLTVWKADPGRAHRWLGSGIYLCACGSSVMAYVREGRIPRYRCKEFGVKSPDHSGRVSELLDQHVEDVIVAWAAKPTALQRLLPKTDAPQTDILGLRAELEALQIRLKEKAVANFHGKITDDQLYLFTEMTNKRIGEISQELASVVMDNKPTVQLVQAAGGEKEMEIRRARVRKSWEAFSLGLKREIVRELVTVRLLPEPARAPFDIKTIEVTWKL